MKRQTKQKRILILGVAAVLILAAGIGIYTQYAKEISNKNMADSANVPEDKNQGYGDEITPAKTKFTEEEKEQLQGYLNRIFSNLEQESKKSGGCCGQEEV